MLELVFRVCGRKKKCVGAGISGGGPPWAHEAGGAPRGVGRALHLRGQVVGPLLCSQCLKSSNIPENKYYIGRAFGELLFSGYFLLQG